MHRHNGNLADAGHRASVFSQKGMMQVYIRCIAHLYVLLCDVFVLVHLWIMNELYNVQVGGIDTDCPLDGSLDIKVVFP